MPDLTPSQEEYFRILDTLHPSPELQRYAAELKRDLRQENQPADKVTVVRGLSRVQGFIPEEPTT